MSRIVVVGNATIDLAFGLRAWPKPGETLLAETMLRSPGGKGLNQAVVASRFGANVHLFAPLGRDENGSYLRRILAEESSLDTHWLDCDADTDISTVWITASGENMIVSSAECAKSVTPDIVSSVAIDRDDLVVLQGNLSAETTIAIAREARLRGARILLNTAPIHFDMANILPIVDLIISNEPEIESLTSRSGTHAAQTLSDRTGSTVLMTCGAAGSVLARNGNATVFQAEIVDAVDTSGAGDAFVGTFAGALSQGLDAVEAIGIATRAAAISVTRKGTFWSFPSACELAKLR